MRKMNLTDLQFINSLNDEIERSSCLSNSSLILSNSSQIEIKDFEPIQWINFIGFSINYTAFTTIFHLNFFFNFHLFFLLFLYFNIFHFIIIHFYFLIRILRLYLYLLYMIRLFMNRLIQWFYNIIIHLRCFCWVILLDILTVLLLYKNIDHFFLLFFKVYTFLSSKLSIIFEL